MSLLFYKRAIEDAVSNQLSAAEELKLRRHLSSCDGCRRYYDTLTVGARLLRGGVNVRPSEVEREFERLTAALDAPKPVVAEGALPVRWQWPSAVAVPVAALVLAGIFVGPRLIQDHRPRTTERGAVARVEPKAGVLVYAQRKDQPAGSPVRLVADLPGSGEAHVSKQDYVQFTIHHELPYDAYVALVGVDEVGEVHIYPAGRESGAVRVPPNRKGRSFGPSIDFSANHRPGLMRLYAVFSPLPLNTQEVEQAARAAGKDLRTSKRLAIPGTAEQVTGLFLIAD